MTAQPFSMSRHLPILILGCGLILAAPPARCGWPEGGLNLTGQPGDEFVQTILPDEAGGVFVSWVHGGQVFLQRIDAAGNIVTGWPARGVLVEALPANTSAIVKSAVGDGVGGLYLQVQYLVACGIDCFESYAKIHRIDAAGQTPPGWSGGFPAGFMASDGAGGLVVGWRWGVNGELRFQRIGPDGNTMWPSEGVVVLTNSRIHEISSLISDGEGSVYFAWSDYRNQAGGTTNRDIYLQRVQVDGVVPWAPDGTPVIVHDADQYRPGVHVDSAGSVLVTWNDQRFAGRPNAYMSRMLRDGSRAAGWPASGVQLSAGTVSNLCCPAVAPDGTGGAIVIGSFGHTGGGDLIAYRRTGNGAIAPGWPTSGRIISRNEVSPSVAIPDGRGGAYVTGSARKVWAHHIDANGLPAPGWLPLGRTIAPSTGQFFPLLASDGGISAYLAWDSDPDGDGTQDVFLQRIAEDGPVAVEISTVSAVAEPGRVRIIWFASEPIMGRLHVQRLRSTDESWRGLRIVTSDASGLIEFEDDEVTSGERLGYRLEITDAEEVSHRGEVWVHVPLAPRLALRGFAPNPVVGVPRISITLAERGPAMIAIYDLQGRLIESRDVGDLGPGSHVIDLSARTWAPGVYSMVLRQGATVLRSRGCIVR